MYLNQKRLIMVGLILLGALSVSFYWMALQAKVPDVSFTTLQGETIALKALRGHTVLVAFWATDCRPCLEEMADLAALQRDYGERGFQIIAVAMAYDPPSRVVSLAKQTNPPYAMALDPLGDLAQAFGGVQQIPQSFLIGPGGRIETRILGKLPLKKLKLEIETMLKEVG